MAQEEVGRILIVSRDESFLQYAAHQVAPSRTLFLKDNETRLAEEVQGELRGKERVDIVLIDRSAFSEYAVVTNLEKELGHHQFLILATSQVDKDLRSALDAGIRFLIPRQFDGSALIAMASAALKHDRKLKKSQRWRLGGTAAIVSFLMSLILQQSPALDNADNRWTAQVIWGKGDGRRIPCTLTVHNKGLFAIRNVSVVKGPASMAVEGLQIGLPFDRIPAGDNAKPRQFTILGDSSMAKLIAESTVILTNKAGNRVQARFVSDDQPLGIGQRGESR